MINSLPPSSTPNIAAPTWVIASHNQGKVRELGELLSPLGINCLSAGSLGIAEPEETGLTFQENALLKAEYVCKASGLPSLADDSGLAIESLNGAPGIYSARLAGPTKDFAAAMQQLEHQLSGKTNRQAAMICALALARPSQSPLVFEGRIEGVMIWPPRGGHGFGYDPAFQPLGYQESFGEMLPAAKALISHRALAFAQLLASPNLPKLPKAI